MDYFNQIYDNAPISGGVVQDSSGNILDRELAPTYSQINMYDKAYGYASDSPGVLEHPNFEGFEIDSNGNLVQKTANETVNDTTRGEINSPEEPNDYLERILGILTDGIFTAKEQNALNLAESERAREFNASEAEKARAFQLMLRDTQIQSTMKQIKEAGINPLLALSGSLGYANASSPAQASTSHTMFGNDNSIVSSLILAVASALGSLTKLIGLAF